MKVELIEEIKFGRDPWYSVSVDEEVVFSSWNKEACESVYDAFATGKISQKTTRNVLKSQEVSLSSSEEILNTNI